MHQAINAFRAALAISCLTISACGGISSAEPEASLNGEIMRTSKALAQSTASASGTSIPTATQIVDSSGNIWTVSAGIIYENGALAGYSNAVTMLLYDNNTIYQENSAGGWWSWSGNTWVSSSDPLNGGSGSSTGSATLSWTAPTQDTDGTLLTDIAGYTIYYGSNPSALTQIIQLANPSATSYVVSNLSTGTYYFAVAAYTTMGTEGLESSVASKTIP